MKLQLLLLSLFTLISGNLVADDQPVPAEETVDPLGDQAAPAPEFDDRFYQKRPLDTAADEQTARCKQLRQRIAELKGKPQRRHAATERYRLECQSGSRSYQHRPGFGGPSY